MDNINVRIRSPVCRGGGVQLPKGTLRGASQTSRGGVWGGRAKHPPPRIQEGRGGAKAATIPAGKSIYIIAYYLTLSYITLHLLCIVGEIVEQFGNSFETETILEQHWNNVGTVWDNSGCLPGGMTFNSVYLRSKTEIVSTRSPGSLVLLEPPGS